MRELGSVGSLREDPLKHRHLDLNLHAFRRASPVHRGWPPSPARQLAIIAAGEGASNPIRHQYRHPALVLHTDTDMALEGRVVPSLVGFQALYPRSTGRVYDAEQRVGLYSTLVEAQVGRGAGWGGRPVPDLLPWVACSPWRALHGFRELELVPPRTASRGCMHWSSLAGECARCPALHILTDHLAASCRCCLPLPQRVVDLLRLKSALDAGSPLEDVPLHLTLQAGPPP